MTLIQHLGNASNPNVHFHILLPPGTSALLAAMFASFLAGLTLIVLAPPV